MKTEKQLKGTECEIGKRYYINKLKTATGICRNNKRGAVDFSDITGLHNYTKDENGNIGFIEGAYFVLAE